MKGTVISLTATLLLAAPASAQTAVISRYGCGTGCAVTVKQLSPPRRLNTQWAVVRAQSTTTMVNFKGKPLSEFRGMKLPAVRSGYNFANCRQGLYAQSDTPEVPLDRIRNVLTLNGDKKTATVYGSIYRQWDALCRAIKD